MRNALGFKIFGFFIFSPVILPTWNGASQALGADIASTPLPVLLQHFSWSCSHKISLFKIFFLPCTPLAAAIPSTTAPLLSILSLQAFRNSRLPPAIPFWVEVLSPQLLEWSPTGWSFSPCLPHSLQVSLFDSITGLLKIPPGAVALLDFNIPPRTTFPLFYYFYHSD